MERLVCSESLNAIQGAIGTVCEAVDAVLCATGARAPYSAEPPTSLQAGPRRAFVAIRPPGHHCDEDTPSGFCFVNNVAVGAAHGISVLPTILLVTELSRFSASNSSPFEIRNLARCGSRCRPPSWFVDTRLIPFATHTPLIALHPGAIQ